MQFSPGWPAFILIMVKDWLLLMFNMVYFLACTYLLSIEPSLIAAFLGLGCVVNASRDVSIVRPLK